MWTCYKPRTPFAMLEYNLFCFGFLLMCVLWITFCHLSEFEDFFTIIKIGLHSKNVHLFLSGVSYSFHEHFVRHFSSLLCTKYPLCHLSGSFTRQSLLNKW